MKLVYSISALATVAVADICNDKCGDFCDQSDKNLSNWDNAGFENAAECAAHSCTASFADKAADWHVCEEGARELEGRKYNKIIKMTKALLDHEGKTTMSLRSLHKKIQNYGCHCFPAGEQLAGGQGDAVDAQDAACRTLSRCHKCVAFDHGISSNENYRFLLKNGDIDCNRNIDIHNNQAKFDLCQCDAEFARELATFWDDSAYNNFFWLSPNQMKKPLSKRDPEHQSKFDYQSVCVSTQVNRADSCCGSYPSRYPYNSASAVECCKSTSLFNTAVSDCCDDGTVAKPGEC